MTGVMRAAGMIGTIDTSAPHRGIDHAIRYHTAQVGRYPPAAGSRRLGHDALADSNVAIYSIPASPSLEQGDAFADEPEAPLPGGGQAGEVFATDGDCGCDGSGECCDSCGGPAGCCRCCPCGPPGRFWLRQEYVGWFMRGGHTPALVATSTDGSLPSNKTLYGDASYNNNYRSGTWTQYGMWFNCCRNWGITGDYLFVGRQSAPFFASSDGDPVLTRPFIDATNGTPTDQLVAFPGAVVGSIGVQNYNSFSGFSVLARHNLFCWTNCCNSFDQGCGCGFCGQDCCRIDAVFGWRNFRFNDNIGINENLTSIDPTSGTAVGTQFNINDSFRTINTFNGFESGVIAQKYRGRWMTEGSFRLAAGNTQQIIAINGSTVVSFPGQPTATNQGGLLALSSNIGRYKFNEFNVIPLFSGRIGYRVTPRFTLLAGYTALFWGQVARAGDQIDTTVNPNLIPPSSGGSPHRPHFVLNTSDLWLQGITLGGEVYF